MDAVEHAEPHESRFGERLLRLVHGRRRVVATLIYASVTAAAYAAALLLRFEFTWPAGTTALFLSTLPVLVAIRAVFSYAFKLAVGRWRFVGVRDVVRLFLAVSAGSAVFFALTWGVPALPRVPRSVLLIEWVLTAYLTAAVWITWRVGFEQHKRRKPAGVKARRVLVVGAGEAGQALVREMGRSATGFDPVAFVDDDPLKWGTLVHGVEVIGSIEDLTEIARAVQPDELVISIPSATPDELRRIVEKCEALNVGFKILPGVEDVLAGDVQVAHLRDVQVEDLLGREPVRLELPELAEDLERVTVLVTGAAGSIGSELARQVAVNRPRCLVLADIAETPMFYVERELRDRHPDLDIVPLILDVADREAVEQTFGRYRPERVFHAAAYKHVPLMESHPRQALRNNVLGTWTVAEAAGRSGAGSFILVSTDKAVRPANVMGASKRLAELVTLDMSERYTDTRFGAVRFGNVLGSSGSVIPLFRWLMEEGKPLTVTHEDVTRYFMTISEASQLILQASLLPDLSGRIAMLEMGEPVRIYDLAKDLLRLSGRPCRPGQNLVVTGLRPGEKLHEELVAPDEAVVETAVRKVKLVGPASDSAPRQFPLLFGALEAGDLSAAVRHFEAALPRLRGEAATSARSSPGGGGSAVVA